MDNSRQQELEKVLEAEGFKPEEAKRIAADMLLRHPEKVDEFIAKSRKFISEYRQGLN
jgi:hypothetical protein